MYYFMIAVLCWLEFFELDFSWAGGGLVCCWVGVG